MIIVTSKKLSVEISFTENQSRHFKFDKDIYDINLSTESQIIEVTSKKGNVRFYYQGPFIWDNLNALVNSNEDSSD